MLHSAPLRVIGSAQRLLLKSVSLAENRLSITARAMSQCEEQTSATQASRTIDFLTLCQNLKVSTIEQCDLRRLNRPLKRVRRARPASVQTTKRTGWIRKGINGPESIADHMYRMGLMAMVIDSPGVDMTK